MTALARKDEHSVIGIRDATDADLPFVLSLLNPEIERSPHVYAEVPLTLDERRRWLNVHQAAGLPVVIAADVSRRQVGWGSLSPHRASSGYRFTVEASVYVDPDHQRRAVATTLLGALEQRARVVEKHAIVAASTPRIDRASRYSSDAGMSRRRGFRRWDGSSARGGRRCCCRRV